MKLEVGNYVRTNQGIAKYLGISKETRFDEEYDIYLFDECIFDNWNTIDIDKIDNYKFKASNNIIDLIEPLDLMYIDIEPNDGHGGIVIPRIAETLNELEKWKKRFESGECKLVYITTHEQIESMQYKVD